VQLSSDRASLRPFLLRNTAISLVSEPHCCLSMRHEAVNQDIWQVGYCKLYLYPIQRSIWYFRLFILFRRKNYINCFVAGQFQALLAVHRYISHRLFTEIIMSKSTQSSLKVSISQLLWPWNVLLSLCKILKALKLYWKCRI